MHRRRSSDSDTFMSPPSRVNVPFSWENKPGMSKVATVGHGDHDRKVLTKHLSMELFTLKLTLPPRLSSLPGSSATFMVVHRQSQLPLRSIQPSLRLNSFRLRSVKEEDPFLAAFKNCTAKSPNVPAETGKKFGRKKIQTMFSFSCCYGGLHS